MVCSLWEIIVFTCPNPTRILVPFSFKSALSTARLFDSSDGTHRDHFRGDVEPSDEKLGTNRNPFRWSWTSKLDFKSEQVCGHFTIQWIGWSRGWDRELHGRTHRHYWLTWPVFVGLVWLVFNNYWERLRTTGDGSVEVAVKASAWSSGSFSLKCFRRNQLRDREMSEWWVVDGRLHMIIWWFAKCWFLIPDDEFTWFQFQL